MARFCGCMVIAALVAVGLGGCGGGGEEAGPFSVSSTVPPNGATGVSAAIVMRFTFTEAADPNTLALAITPAVATTTSWQNGDTQLTITSAGPLAEATEYTVDITTLTSAAGNALSGTTRLRFTTANPSAGQYVLWRYPGGDVRPPVLPFRAPPKPAKGASVNDPLYNTLITRATDRAVDRYGADAVINEYSRIDPENADGSLVILRGTNGTWYLYALPGFALVREVDFGTGDPEPRWDATDSNVIYYVRGPALRRYDVAADQSSVVHDFTHDETRCAYARTRWEGDASLDRRYWCLQLDDDSFETLSVVCYDREADDTVGRLRSFPAEFDHVSMDMSGTHCVIAYDTVAPIAYHRDFTRPVQLPVGSVGHADFALDASGRDVYVYQNVATDWIAMADLETGGETNLVPIPFDDNLDIGLHFSGNCDAEPGWVLVSTYGQTATAKSWMDRSLFMIQLQARPIVWRLAQTYSLQGPEADYFGEAFAAINRRGTRVWWGSNWNATGASRHAYDTYMAELPADWDTEIVALAR